MVNKGNHSQMALFQISEVLLSTIIYPTWIASDGFMVIEQLVCGSCLVSQFLLGLPDKDVALFVGMSTTVDSGLDGLQALQSCSSVLRSGWDTKYPHACMILSGKLT